MKTSVTPKERTQPKVWRTDITALRACDSSTWVKSPFLVDLSFLVEVLQPLFSNRFVARVSQQRVGISRLSMIVRVNVVQNRTVVDCDFWFRKRTIDTNGQYHQG